MINVTARNVNEAFPIALMHVQDALSRGLLREVNPRGQRRMEFTEPFCTTYTHPRERVLFDVTRDANPFFHFMEALWILAGRNDVEWLSQWLPNIKDYSDDGTEFHGAYGARLRMHGQLNHVIERLKREPDGNRAVLAIYDAHRDSRYEGADMPCNCTVFLSLRDERLDLTVANRSNDLIWGTYGANVVQFSTLQEYIATAIGAEVGTYVQFSNNTHVYPDNPATIRCLEQKPRFIDFDPYDSKPLQPYPLINGTHLDVWKKGLTNFINDTPPLYDTLFIQVAQPMRNAYRYYRAGLFTEAFFHAENIVAPDWREACLLWLRRRETARAAKLGAAA